MIGSRAGVVAVFGVRPGEREIVVGEAGPGLHVTDRLPGAVEISPGHGGSPAGPAGPAAAARPDMLRATPEARDRKGEENGAEEPCPVQGAVV